MAARANTSGVSAAPIAQSAEAADLKSAQSGFESQLGDVLFAKFVLVAVIVVVIVLAIVLRIKRWRGRRR